MTTKSTITEASPADMKTGDLYVTEKSGVIVIVTAAPMNPRVAKAFTGVVLHSGTFQNDYPIGFHDDDWSIESFKPFHGTITLESTP